MEIIKKYSEVNKIINKELVMLVAKSHTCSSCLTIERTLESHLKHYDDIEKYGIFVDDIEKFRGDYLIFSVPTIIIFSEGKELLRESRYINYEKVDRLIQMFNN